MSFLGIGKDVFSCIAAHLPDGRAAALLSRVCKHAYALVAGNPRLAWLKRHHVISGIESARELEQVLYVVPGIAYVKAAESTILKNVITQMWYRFGFNFFLFGTMTEHPGRFNCGHFDLDHVPRNLKKLQDLIDALSPKKTQWSDCIEDDTTLIDAQGNVTIMTNHYGDDYPDCLDFDIETFEWMRQELCPGMFDWRWINFNDPVKSLDYLEWKAHGKKFHRGTCIQLIFRADARIVGHHADLIRTLKRVKLPIMAWSIPLPGSGYVRPVYPPHPPTIEFKALDRHFAKRRKIQ